MAEKGMREYGSGSISRRKDGRWTARVQVGRNEHGKPIVKALYGRTEAEVKRKLREYKKKASAGDIINIKKGTVAVYMTNWLTTNKRNVLKPKSYDRLESTLNNQVIPQIGHIQLAALKPADIQKMINALKDGGKSYSTIKKAYDAVNDCFRTGVIQKTVAENPTLGVTLPAKNQFEQSEIKFFTKEEVDALYIAARKTYKNGARVYRLGEIIIFDINTGLRLGELLVLKWSDIDMESRLMTIQSNRVLVRNRGEGAEKRYITVEQNTTKTKAGTRQMYLNDDAYGALLHLMDVTGRFKYVFANRNGGSSHQKTMDELIHYIEVSAGIPEERQFGFHSLRHPNVKPKTQISRNFF